ncbi:RING-finger domain containing protein [Metarhizium album ARSEF 1941]|uniref:RING-finger domain containing protein n=1 Tax=Metarhizium album (strain ARSEF 1941) TaxID=1081103 RepID=A0A0B2WP77_METAS|nr:RING-finger domain containing protein [Metarhizium album ARSEF 1941]KHN95262.1 RING-finger domain containing protein [Metarhizium album ARSEF 1941]
MDQMNLLPSNAQRYESSRDLLHAASNHWIAHSHGSPASSWPSQPLPLGSFYFAQHQAFQRPSMDGLGPAHPMHSGQHGTLPPPDRSVSVRGMQTPESYPRLPAAAVYWSSTMQPAPVSSSGATISSVPSPFGNMNTSARDLALRPPAATDWAPPVGATSGTHSVTFPQISSSEGLPNAPSHQVSPSTAASHFPLSPDSPRRQGQTSSPTPYRSHRSQTATAVLSYRDNSSLLAPSSDRRRQAHPRARRSMASRQTSSDLGRSQDDAAQTPQVLGDDPTSRSSRRGSHVISASQVEDVMARQMQMYRGTVQTKMVASKAALQSLECVEASALPESERTCVICYNEYGVASPEGINEAPIRLPQCKHIFGDHCIKKWLEDSDSCPYCRSKLQSEPKLSFGSARTFMHMMRLRGLPLPTGISEEMIARVVSRPVGELELQELLMRSHRPADRRSPPDDASGHDHRRTRQRLSSSVVMSESHVEELSTSQPHMPLDGLPSEPSSQPPGGHGSLNENMWVSISTPGAYVPSEPFHGQPPPRAGWTEGLEHTSGASVRRGTASEPPTSRPTRPQIVDPPGTVIANGSSIPPPTILNPLQRSINQQRTGTSLSGSAAAPQSSSAPTANSSSAEAELSPLRPSRNRPW